MGGLAVLFILGLYFLLTLLAVIIAKPLWAKGLVLLAALLIPTADAMYGRYKLKQMCAAEAGLKVYKVAHNVEGFMDDGTHSDYWVKEHGYQFAEDRPMNGTTTRYSRRDGQVIQDNQVTPKSKYRLRQSYGDDKSVYRLSQYLVEDVSTGEVLAKDTRIAYKGGWAERFLAAFSDAGVGNVAWCTPPPWPDDPRIDIIVNSLKH